MACMNTQLNEDKVMVRCRKADASIMSNAISEAAKAFKAALGKVRVQSARASRASVCAPSPTTWPTDLWPAPLAKLNPSYLHPSEMLTPLRLCEESESVRGAARPRGVSACRGARHGGKDEMRRKIRIMCLPAARAKKKARNRKGRGQERRAVCLRAVCRWDW